MSQFQQGMSKDILIFLGLVGVFVHDALTRLWIELAWGVPRGHVFFCRGIAMSLLRVQMQQLGTFHILHLSEDAYQLFHIMSVEGTEIAYIHTFEHVLLV